MGLFDAPLLFDGGLGTLLEAQGHDISGPLWSARVLRENPALIESAHAEFFAAGAQVATTASYQVTFDVLGEEAEALLRRSVGVARGVVDKRSAQPGLLVAASIGPYGAGSGKGTDYDGAYGLTRGELQRWHARRVAVLADTNADFLLAETIPNVDEAAALLELLSDQPKPFALSITGSIAADPAKLSRVVELAHHAPRLGALGVNCVSPSQALAVVKRLRAGTDKPLLACPNSGESWDHGAHDWRPAPAETLSLPEAVVELRAAGVSLLGGCCRVGPTGIRRMREALFVDSK
ncbi:homocysteine S-methyltransferase [Corynebacterium minutissimum]|uniref:Homocysteine S-methyltransferase n=1 Tax=Corynebacterium minutissimum TaxID=38301 RepID=A0A2X4REX9_9CORY|nr:homocysteine S-methyltransferase [Corynebacterium minutissimum]KHO30063.1 5-methyltetrahydrofolate--homocysteine methyltransferase [Corynebacterium minutissimum]QPS60547.1 homocysteine S-methyltransferase [Corynebacterium minutissimum]QQA78665.1 homocysteine S-methyltransferase [Corynebacterium minutissimum]SQI00591.1 homocysteine methyltransferase [Corynebacterium minutissimum]VEG05341.1 homocysteine methyltransferase [Corynebacterium minutissimum]